MNHYWNIRLVKRKDIVVWRVQTSFPDQFYVMKLFKSFQNSLNFTLKNHSSQNLDVILHTKGAKKSQSK